MSLCNFYPKSTNIIGISVNGANNIFRCVLIHITLTVFIISRRVYIIIYPVSIILLWRSCYFFFHQKLFHIVRVHDTINKGNKILQKMSSVKFYFFDKMTNGYLTSITNRFLMSLVLYYYYFDRRLSRSIRQRSIIEINIEKITNNWSLQLIIDIK